MISAGATGGVVHNRLTHSIKVTAVARAVAVRLLPIADRELLRELGGLDHVVVQAAANAHDLGHPPFGHLGERVLDQLLRERFGLQTGSRATRRPSGSSPSSRCTVPATKGSTSPPPAGPRC